MAPPFTPPPGRPPAPHQVRKSLPRDINAKIKEQLDGILGAEPANAPPPPAPGKVDVCEGKGS